MCRGVIHLISSFCWVDLRRWKLCGWTVVRAGMQLPSWAGHTVPSQRMCPPGQAGGRSGPIPWNPRRIPEEMNAGVACGGVKSLPATVSAPSGLSLIRLFTEDPPAGHFLPPKALTGVSQCTSACGFCHWLPTPSFLNQCFVHPPSSHPQFRSNSSSHSVSTSVSHTHKSGLNQEITLVRSTIIACLQDM